jgi:hypothetical protein
MTEQTTTTEEVKKSPELSLTDLALMRNVIEIVSQRGAFKASELASVGQLFNKLNDFLNAAEAQAKANQETQGE